MRSLWHRLTFLVLTLPALALAGRGKDAYELEWTDLMPPEDLKAIEEAPPIRHFGMGPMGDVFQSANTVAKMDGMAGKLAGYVVPVSATDDGLIDEFFFVPYFGACLHMPPPPPNQIIHVKPPKPIKLDNMWDPFWLVGTVRIGMTSNSMAASAYRMDDAHLEPYEAYPDETGADD